MTTIIAMVIVLLAFMFIVVRAVINAHRAQVTTGREGIVGETGLAIEDFDAQGRGVVKVHGEIWQAACGDPVHAGEGIVVTGVEGMTLKVNKK